MLEKCAAAATWGYTEEEAQKNIKEVVEMVVEELVQDNEPVPDELIGHHISKDWEEALYVVIEKYRPALNKLAE